MSTPVFDLILSFTAQTKQAIFDRSLALAEFVGLPVSSWRIGDPTRTQLEFQAEHLADIDAQVAEFAKAAFLDTAEREWLDVKAEQDFGQTRDDASFATGQITLTNSSAAIYSWDTNDLTFKNEITGKTYKNNEPVSLSGIGSTDTFAFVAEEAGSESSTGANTLSLLTTVLGVTVTSNTSATGTDAQGDAELRDMCRLSMAALSPSGPSDAYRYVALKSELTGIQTPKKAVAYGDTDTGITTVYVSGYAAAISDDDLETVETALRRYALPLCCTLDLDHATQVGVTVSLSLTVKSAYLTTTVAQLEDDIEQALTALMQSINIGEGLTVSKIVGVVYSVVGPAAFVSCEVTSPIADVTADQDENLYVSGFSADVETI